MLLDRLRRKIATIDAAYLETSDMEQNPTSDQSKFSSAPFDVLPLLPTECDVFRNVDSSDLDYLHKLWSDTGSNLALLDDAAHGL